MEGGASLMKLFSLLIVLCLTTSAYGARSQPACHLSQIAITQAETGGTVEGNPEYEVTVSNGCGCPQSNVVVKCYGLSSVEPVDPRAIKPVDDDNCVVVGGRPIGRGSPVKFKYAWMTPQDFPLVSSKIKCL